MRRLSAETRRFEDEFWSGGSLDDLYQRVGEQPGEPMSSVFVAAMQEWRRSARSGLTATERAKENLGKLALVGTLERLDAFCGRFGEIFGVTLRIPHDNASPAAKAKQKALVTDEIRERVRALCAPDLEVYEHAREHYIP